MCLFCEVYLTGVCGTSLCDVCWCVLCVCMMCESCVGLWFVCVCSVV